MGHEAEVKAVLRAYQKALDALQRLDRARQNVRSVLLTAPDSDIGEGPFHTWVATAGLWRYNDDAGNGGPGTYGPNGAPFSTLVTDHGDEQISDICITTGFTAGEDLSALLRSWELNSKDYAFGR